MPVDYTLDPDEDSALPSGVRLSAGRRLFGRAFLELSVAPDKFVMPWFSFLPAKILSPDLYPVEKVCGIRRDHDNLRSASALISKRITVAKILSRAKPANSVKICQTSEALGEGFDP